VAESNIAAEKATKLVYISHKASYCAKATTLSLAIVELRERAALADGVGKNFKEHDIALTGSHTRALYKSPRLTSAKILAQLRTGMCRLNGYLSVINEVESSQCKRDRFKESVRYFIFECNRWRLERREIFRQTETRQGSLSFILGGKTLTVTNEWSPNMAAVRATIQYALNTGRLSE
jgi:hypothetical protein